MITGMCEISDAARRLVEFDARRDELARGSGDADAVKAAEKRLQRAQAAAGQPWATRASAARLALRDADRDRARFAAEHYRELRAAHARDAEAAAAAVDAALEALVAAYRHREQVAGQAAQLWRLVAQPRPNLTARSNAEEAVRAADAALMAGPEPPPSLPATFLPPGAVIDKPTAQPEPVTVRLDPEFVEGAAG
jgi:hypothetical protein